MTEIELLIDELEFALLGFGSSPSPEKQERCKQARAAMLGKVNALIAIAEAAEPLAEFNSSEPTIAVSTAKITVLRAALDALKRVKA